MEIYILVSCFAERSAWSAWRRSTHNAIHNDWSHGNLHSLSSRTDLHTLFYRTICLTKTYTHCDTEWPISRRSTQNDVSWRPTLVVIMIYLTHGDIHTLSYRTSCLMDTMICLMEIYTPYHIERSVSWRPWSASWRPWSVSWRLTHIVIQNGLPDGVLLTLPCRMTCLSETYASCHRDLPHVDVRTLLRKMVSSAETWAACHTADLSRREFTPCHTERSASRRSYS